MTRRKGLLRDSGARCRHVRPIAPARLFRAAVEAAEAGSKPKKLAGGRVDAG
jgi:hypothetical protein